MTFSPYCPALLSSWNDCLIPTKPLIGFQIYLLSFLSCWHQDVCLTVSRSMEVNAKFWKSMENERWHPAVWPPASSTGLHWESQDTDHWPEPLLPPVSTAPPGSSCVLTPSEGEELPMSVTVLHWLSTSGKPPVSLSSSKRWAHCKITSEPLSTIIIFITVSHQKGWKDDKGSGCGHLIGSKAWNQFGHIVPVDGLGYSPQWAQHHVQNQHVVVIGKIVVVQGEVAHL